jgi:hypothetical protein
MTDEGYDTGEGEEMGEGEIGPMYGPQTEEQFRALHLGSLLYVWHRLMAFARDSPSPHLLQHLTFDHFCWLAFRTSL